MPKHLTIDKQLLLVTGKGGVGKSALTATLGRSLAAAGRRVLVLEIDPRENLHQLLDVPPSGGEIVQVSGSLYLQNLKPLAVVDWLVERQVKVGLLVSRIKKSAVYQRFAEGAPGLTEMAIIGHALRLVEGEVEKLPAFDTVVLDAPATGHGIYLLSAARLFHQAIGEGPVAEIAQRAADFVADASRCGEVVVTLAEEMPVQEAIELRQALEQELDRSPELLVVNGLYPPLPAAEGSSDDQLAKLWRRRRQVNERELERLDGQWAGLRIDLPLLPIDRGPELVAALSQRLNAGLDNPFDQPEGQS